ncbi:hypothetical protein I553_10477 [Mycobacterium xenopi 4042]|uniref:Uncharacterized protein n=1 Tax=Mycobacterium xenopi 4042 TaxID=1299334 RepID=X8DKX7_MYCXE|nr:hypothetical protein I552_3624 [Mycobacterium xenopi 3993]EUA68353.1 hypothetical protein I553_10477 [Mycobacterium xenopi 4042]
MGTAAMASKIKSEIRACLYACSSKIVARLRQNSPPMNNDRLQSNTIGRAAIEQT